MQFDDPLVAGATLVRLAIQSADYVPGVSGWRIARNGDVEFNSGNFRGDVVVTAADGTRVTILASNGSEINFRPPTAFFNEFADKSGSITSSVASDGTTALYAYLVLKSPVVDDTTRVGSNLYMFSEPEPGQVHSQMRYRNSLARIEGDLRVYEGDLLIDRDIIGVGPDKGQLGRGIVEVVSSSAATGAIGTTETVVLTSTNRIWREDYAYRIDLNGVFTTSVGSSRPLWRVRKGATAAGAVIGGESGIETPTINGSNTTLNMVSYFKVGSSPVTTPLSVTIVSAAGYTTTWQATRGRHMVITALGPASLFPDATVLS